MAQKRLTQEQRTQLELAFDQIAKQLLGIGLDADDVFEEMVGECERVNQEITDGELTA